jgi:hypothetical protein
MTTRAPQPPRAALRQEKTIFLSSGIGMLFPTLHLLPRVRSDAFDALAKANPEPMHWNPSPLPDLLSNKADTPADSPFTPLSHSDKWSTRVHTILLRSF